jgi:hypothetical protein
MSQAFRRFLPPKQKLVVSNPSRNGRCFCRSMAEHAIGPYLAGCTRALPLHISYIGERRFSLHARTRTRRKLALERRARYALSAAWVLVVVAWNNKWFVSAAAVAATAASTGAYTILKVYVCFLAHARVWKMLENASNEPTHPKGTIAAADVPHL